jgi:hypothetical protein
MHNEKMPVGKHTLPDGREFEYMNDVQLLAFTREGNRKQHLADMRLGLQLDKFRKVETVPPGPPRVQLEIF